MSLKSVIINPSGYFGEFGGAYVPEMLVPIFDDIRERFFDLIGQQSFNQELHSLYQNYIGRPSPLVYCENLTNEIGGAQIYMKNEGVNHTGAHKINHCVGQILVAKHLGKKRIIAETGAGQHGLATASVAAKFGMKAHIYMGEVDYGRQRPNVNYMKLAGAEVIPVQEGARTLRSAVNAAIRDLIGNSHDSYYLLGTACGPNPYPSMNVYFQKVIGEEVRKQLQEKTGGLPDYLVACVGGGSNSQGLFYDFLDDSSVKMIGVEAGGKGVDTSLHAVRFHEKTPGVVEGFKSYFLQTNSGHIRDTYSISAGLDYSGVSPQLAYLGNIGRVEMTSVTDNESLEAIKMLMKTEGILPALESAHAVAETIKLAKTLSSDKTIVCNVSGRGEKDLFITAPYFDPEFTAYLQTQINKR